MKTIPQLVQELKNTFSDRKNIAPVESSSTASRAYAVGKKFFYNNILYRCTVAIASGGVITPGTNCVTENDVETQVDSLKETLTNEVNNNGVKNVFDINAVISLDKSSLNANNGFTNTDTDTLTEFRVNVATQNSSGTWSAALLNQTVSSIGYHEYTITIPSDAIKIRIKHNGSVRNIGILNPIHKTGNAIISFDLASNDPTIVGGLVVNNIMIRDTHIVDTTYEPYAATNQQLTGLISNTFENGAVNLLPNTGTTKVTSDGTTSFTWTVNENKTVSVSAPSYPITLAQTVVFNISMSAKLCKELTGKVIRMTGCPVGGGTTGKYFIVGFRAGSSTGGTGSYHDVGNGISFKWVNDGSVNPVVIGLQLLQGYTMTGPLTFKPMLSLASMNLNYDDYVPYAMTNKQLTDDVALNDKTSLLTLNSGYHRDGGYIIKIGKLIVINLGLYRDTEFNESTEVGTTLNIGTLGEDIRPKIDISCYMAHGSLVFRANGSVTYYPRDKNRYFAYSGNACYITQ